MSERSALHYEVQVGRRGPLDAAVEAGPRVVIRGGPPPEFGGDPAVWSPEHLLVASAALCFWSTLEWFARRRAVPVVGFECHAEGNVEKTPRGLAFTGIRLGVTVTTATGQEARIRELLDTAKASCLVANSLTCPVELVADVRVEDDARSDLGVAL
jgi:organic hydroperoxide reductase OsmC/OhrA